MKIKHNEALIIVDIQNDFCEPNGSLAVKGSLNVIDKTNELIKYFDTIVYTKELHPKDHKFFATVHNVEPFTEIKDLGIVWPVHCVKDEYGSELHAQLITNPKNKNTIVCVKGTDKNKHPYSCFYEGNNIDRELRSRNINTLYVCGLATDYCVAETVKDALKLKYNVFIVVDAIAGVNEETSKKAISEMYTLGTRIVTVNDIISVENN